MIIRRPSAAAIFVAVALLLLGLSSVWLSGPPAPIGEDAPDNQFAADRAMAHVRAIAARPHPMGSAEHAQVREYLVRTLDAMGLSVQHQTTMAVRVLSRGGTNVVIRAGRVHNLLARMPGTGSTGAVLLAAHYDSVPAAPGAADAGSAVAAVLEAVRALRAEPRLRNDVIVLITDGEEDALLGAAAFVDEHPWAGDVRFILNFEARGTRGPSQMFETTPGNGVIVAEWASVTPHPSGSSLGYEIYKRLPNDTDFTVFKKLDAAGLNFAFIENVAAYHTPLDATEALNRGSLQDDGGTALALTRRFGDLNLRALEARDAVFFSLPLGVAFHYPMPWVTPLAGLAAVAWIWVLVRRVRQRAASIGGIVFAAIVAAALVAGAVFAGWRYGRLLTGLHERWLPDGDVTTNAACALALVCGLSSLWAAVYALLRKKFAPHTLALGNTFVWVLASGAVAVWLPGASYAVLWPLVGGLAAIALLPAAAATRLATPIRALALLAVALPTIVIVMPTAASLFSAVGVSREGGAALAICTMLVLGTLVPLIEVVTEGRRWWPGAVAMLACLGALAVGAVTAPYDASHPKPVNLVYVLDADSGRATWATQTGRSNPWLAQYLTNQPATGPLSGFTTSTAQYLTHPAPAVRADAPALTLVSDTAEAGDRVLTLQAAAPTGARMVSIRATDAIVLDTWIAGRRAGGAGGASPWDRGRWLLEYVNPPSDGIQVQVRVKGQAPVTLVVIGRALGLPDVPGTSFKPRPPSLMPIHGGDATLVRRSFTF